MNKLIAVLALLALATGCAETTTEGHLMMADMDHGPAVTGDGPAPRAFDAASRATALREPRVASRPARAEILHCAQCR